MAHDSHPFDEELLSGFLDGSLSHREMQRVRLRLEEDPEARRLYEELQALRSTALSTRFLPPEDVVWAELPATRTSRISRSLGWFVVCTWLVLVTLLALWRFLSETGDPLEIFLVLGLPGGLVLLFLSVLLDRLKSLPSDRYRDVHR
ncbi:MAG: hypothetical protein AAF725_14845 [Acidobacteriota bacterium]